MSLSKQEIEEAKELIKFLKDDIERTRKENEGKKFRALGDMEFERKKKSNKAKTKRKSKGCGCK